MADDAMAGHDSGALARAQARIVELENLVAALRRQLADRAESLPELLPKFLRRDEIPAFTGADEAPVDLVLTVKNTYDFLVPCLESVFRNTEVPFRLFLNDNASADPRTPDYLRSIRDRYPDRVTLFLQERDLGFPDAVNLMLAETTNDVILVNADTVLPPGWASRLLWPIRHSGERVASCTPFTNAGWPIGFPRLDADSDLFEGLDLDRLDRVFQAAKPEEYWPMATGGGFCMAMSRVALNAIGLLDAETFRPAYGEEVDWCCRATAVGFANVLVPNLFVYHKHGATIQRETSFAREELRNRHAAIVAKRYPDLEHRTLAFVDDPGYRSLRDFLLFMASAEAAGGLGVVVTDYAAAARECRRPPAFPPDRPFALLARHPDSGEYLLRFAYREYAARFTSLEYNWIIKALYRVRVAEILIEIMPTDADRDRLLRALRRLGERMGAKATLCNGEPIREGEP